MTTFEFRFDPTWALPVRLASGATPGNSRVVVDDDVLVVRFGWLGVTTPVTNVRDVQVAHDYQWFKAIGPRLSLADRGATYGSNADGGVCLCFHEPVSALPLGGPNPGLTVTVADLDGLAGAVRAAANLDT